MLFKFIPQELKNRRQWAQYEIVHIANDPKPKKIPLRLNGQLASATDPTTWATFDEVKKVIKKNRNKIGYFLSEEDPYTFIDLDNCVKAGKINKYAKRLLKQFDSYSELSQSGNGIHICIKAKVPPGGNRKGNIEIYDHARGMIMTGRHIKTTSFKIADRNTVLSNLHSELFPQAKIQRTPPAPILHLEDNAIIERLLHNSKSKSLYKKGFGRMNHSDADFALCCKIAQYSDDPVQIDRIFRGSKLIRAKWDATRGYTTYGRLTIEKAMANRNANWIEDLGITPKNRILSNHISNYVFIVENHPQFNSRIAFNAFSNKIEKLDRMPWESPVGDWADLDDENLRLWIMETFKDSKNKPAPDPGQEHAHIAIDIVAHRYSFHPVQRYLNSLKWDEGKRAEKWLIDLCGAEDNAYTRAVSKCFLIGAVARIMKPGCKMDNVLLLEGEQGEKKSTMLRNLMPNPAWFSDMFFNIQDKDAYLQMRGKWIIEIADMAAFKRQDIDMQKQFLTRQVDVYREPYGHYAHDYPRQCVFVATSNQSEHHDDETGWRRYWPVQCKKSRIDAAAIIGIRDQLWAEAKFLYDRGEPWYLTDEIETMAQKEQMDRMVTDPWESVIRALLGNSKKAQTYTILTDFLNVPVEQQDKSKQMRVAKILTILGFRKKREGKERKSIWIKK